MLRAYVPAFALTAASAGAVLLVTGGTVVHVAGAVLLLAGLAALLGTGAVAIPGSRRAYAKRVARVVGDGMVELYAATEGYNAESPRLHAELGLDDGPPATSWPEALERLDRLEATIQTAEPERAAALRALRDERSAAFARVNEKAVEIAQRTHGRLAAIRAPGSMAEEKAGHVAAAGAYLAAYRELADAWSGQERERLLRAAEGAEHAQRQLVERVRDGAGARS